MADFVWRGDEFMADLADAIEDGLEVVAVELADDYGEVLNRQSSNKTNGGRPSQPGEPPAKDTGTLGRSISYFAEDGQSIRVGVSRYSPAAQYALPLEYGTTRMAARPWLRPTLAAFAPRANALFVKGVKGSPKMKRWLD